MRWERLFDDLEAQLDAVAAAELAGEVAERTRYERAQLTLADRLVAWVGEPVTLDLLGGASVTGRLSQAAEQWVVVLHGPRPALVPTSAIVAVGGLGAPTSAADRNAVLRRLGFPAALRAVARDRSPVRIELADGRALSGTVDAVGADHLDLAEHAPDELRRPTSVRGVRAVALAAVTVVRPAAGSSSLAD